MGREVTAQAIAAAGLFGGALGVVGAIAHRSSAGTRAAYRSLGSAYGSERVRRQDRSDRRHNQAPLRLVGGSDTVGEQVVAQVDELSMDRRDLERRCALLSDALESIPDPTLVIGPDQRIVLANQAAGGVFGFDCNQVIDQLVCQVVADQAWVDRIEKATSAPLSVTPVTFEHASGSGRMARTYEVTISPLQDRDGSCSDRGSGGVVINLHDVTHQVSASANQSDFVSNVSHELRTPLSSIKASMEMLIDGEDTDEAMRKEFYEIVHSEAERLSRLITTILDIGRIESGAVNVHPQRVDLKQIVREVSEVLRPQAMAKHIDLGLRLEGEGPILVDADRDMIYRASMNLLSNAIKYTLRNGKVTARVGTADRAGSAEVSIKDTGVGVSPDDLPRIFDKCYRVPEHKKLATGSGLGLNLVKQIIEVMHAGTVEAESTLGRGSTFTYRLPLAEDDHTAELTKSGGGGMHHARRQAANSCCR